MAAVSTVSTASGIAAAAHVVEPPPVTPTVRALSQAVSKAVSRLNENGFAGAGREVTISLDPRTHKPVVRVVDTNTREVLRQWPSEYVLHIAEDYKARGSG